MCFFSNVQNAFTRLLSSTVMPISLGSYEEHSLVVPGGWGTHQWVGVMAMATTVYFYVFIVVDSSTILRNIGSSFVSLETQAVSNHTRGPPCFLLPVPLSISA